MALSGASCSCAIAFGTSAGRRYGHLEEDAVAGEVAAKSAAPYGVVHLTFLLSSIVGLLGPLALEPSIRQEVATRQQVMPSVRAETLGQHEWRIQVMAMA